MYRFFRALELSAVPPLHEVITLLFAFHLELRLFVLRGLVTGGTFAFDLRLLERRQLIRQRRL